MKINSKKIEIILLVTISSATILSMGAKEVINTRDTKEDISQTATAPVSGKVVILDAGHGGEDRWSGG